MRYFKKYDPTQAFVDSKGRLRKFPSFGNGLGGIATDDADLIREFDLAMVKSVGGIAEVTEKEFEDLKKKPMSSPNLRVFASLDDLKKVGESLKSAAGGKSASASNFVTVPNVGGPPIQIPVDQPKATGYRPRSVER